MVALNRDSANCPPGLQQKFFILGALASGLLLYGMSMIYGRPDRSDVAKIAKTVEYSRANDPFSSNLPWWRGLAFKLGAVPFHMWVPTFITAHRTAMNVVHRRRAQDRGLDSLRTKRDRRLTTAHLARQVPLRWAIPASQTNLRTPCRLPHP